MKKQENKLSPQQNKEIKQLLWLYGEGQINNIKEKLLEIVTPEQISTSSCFIDNGMCLHFLQVGKFEIQTGQTYSSPNYDMY